VRGLINRHNREMLDVVEDNTGRDPLVDHTQAAQKPRTHRNAYAALLDMYSFDFRYNPARPSLICIIGKTSLFAPESGESGPLNSKNPIIFRI
jgi:hypothetical protein